MISYIHLQSVVDAVMEISRGETSDLEILP